MMEINNNGTIIKVYPSDESELTTGVMTSGKVVLHFRSDQDIKLEQGATIEFLGNTYTLIYPQETKKLWRGYLECIATFYSSAEQLKHKLLKDPSNIARTSFVFAGSPTDFATLVARSMGREWSVGNCIATSYDKTIAFKEESCWAALGRVAEEFHTEWVVEGKSISLRKDERYKEDPLPLSYGKGNGFLSGVSQRGNADNLPISRLYVLGSSRNIDPTKYGASTLHLPKSWSGEGMRTNEAGNYIELLEGNGAEGAIELTDLYPHRVGMVSSVVTVNEAKHFYDIIDSSIPEELNYNDYRIRGEKAILKFETGALAGRQFEIRQSETALSGYHHQERRFELIPSEQDGFIMPSKEWAPKAGDKYAVFGIALPQEYVTRAENELLKEAIRTLSERSLPQFTFEGEVDGIWAKRKWLEIGGKLVPGGHVLFSDAEFHPEGTVIRITSMAQKVNNPTAPNITLSTALVGGSLWNVLNRAEAQEVLSQKRDRELQRSQRQSYEQALEHIGMVERAVEGVEGFSKRIKPSVIETMGLLVGSQATQLDFVERYGSLKSVPMAINYNPNDKRVTISNAFIRHQTIGITSITNARKPTDYRYWSVARYTSPALTDTEQSYYIYAKVERKGKGGNYLLSPDPLPFETTTHYHLLIGTLSSVIDGDRAYNRLYGFSMVTPGQILTDTISSANGNMTIDLQNGSIISDQIEFRRPDGSTKSVEEVITDTVQVGGRNLALRTQQPRRLSAGYAYYILSEYLTKDTDYTIQFDVEVLTPPEDNRFMVYFAYSTHLFTRVYIPFESGKTHYSATIKTPNKDGAKVDSLKSVYIYPHGWGNGGDTVSDIAFSNVKLERGTVATDWTPAPEDVQAEIDKEAKAREAGDKAQADSTLTLQQALDALRESGANDNATLTDLINKANQRLDNLQEQADGEVSNWFYPGAPAPDKAPENEWTTNGLKARHIGDTYTSTDESGRYMGKSWRYTTEFKWQEIHDTLVSQALAQASKAQTTADGKSTTFLVKPTKYEEGDTWVMESSQVVNGISYEAGTMLFAKQGSNAFIESHWVDKVRYIGATQLKESEEASKRAWEAYANAQAEAERVKAEAHADGIVTAEEQARIQATNKALETAKAYAKAQDKLLEESQKAYADGVLTEAEKRAIEVAEKEAKLAETNANAYADGVLTEAEKKAIAQAQKAYDDAVTKAKELDGQIQVGGRNLLRNKDIIATIANQISVEYEQVQPKEGRNTYTLSFEYWIDENDTATSRRIFLNGAGLWIERVIADSKWHRFEHTIQLTLDESKYPLKGWLTDYSSRGNRVPGMAKVRNVKLERGTVATDWSPAPEDVQAEIDAINANPPRINQTTKNWEVYVPSQGKYVDTGRTSVGDDGKAPKIVDGYWYEWDSNKGQYTNTDIKARGIDGKDAVRVRENLMRYSNISSESWVWYPSVTQGRFSLNVNGGAITAKGGDKCTDDYNAEKGRYGFLVISWKGLSDYTDPEAQFVYSAKIRLRAGEAKLLEFGNRSLEKSFSTSAPIKLVGDPLSVYCVKRKREQGIAVGLALYLKTDSIVEIYDIKIERVEEGEDPRPTAYLPHPDDLKGKDVDPKLLNEINAGLSNANTLITTLEKTAKELKEGKLDTKDLPDLQYLLNALQKGDTKIAGGLVLSKIIALSNQVDRITAYLSGYDGTSGDGKILRAGIQYTKTKEDVKPIRSFLTDFCGYKNVEAIPHVNNVITKEALFTWLRQQKEPFEKFYKALSGGTVSFNPSINSSSIDLSKTNAIIYSHSDSNSEAVAIRHDGTGHFGDIHLNGDRIDYQKTQDANPYLTVGRGTYSTIEEVIRKNDYRSYNPSNITNKSFDYDPKWNTSNEQVSTVEIEVANDNTKVTITVELMQVDTRIYAKNPDKPGWVHTELQAKLNGHHIKGVMEMYNYGYTKEMPADPGYSSEHWGSHRGPGMPTDETGRREWRLEEGNKSSRSVEYSVVLPKGTHQLEFVFTQVASSDKHSLPATARVEGIKVLQEFKTDFKQALISPTGARFYGGRDRYFDINYNAYSNAPTAQLTGGLKVDYIDMPGVPLCGVMVKSTGGVVKSFGRYKNKWGTGQPQVDYDYSTKRYTVHHSIPHDHYIPIIQVTGYSGNNGSWSLTPRVFNISPYSFEVAIITNNDNYTQNGFSYTCFLAE
ncbi:hypothetical protein [Porphyromonas somerae]|uniref:hypothetical protein n=1 Tax=Porphyromonas somerae TaxID=322095 RepID=UPI002A80F1A7|nr:hypothetical protein [Porphyromonas somerae]MDY3884097.1 hypothetical protein [Porphyromonas somerae]